MNTNRLQHYRSWRGRRTQAKLAVILMFVFSLISIWSSSDGLTASGGGDHEVLSRTDPALVLARLSEPMTPAVEKQSGEKAKKDTCVQCHREMGDALAAPVTAMQHDIHYQRDLSCADCHGGDPTEEDMDRAMDPRRGFVGRPTPQDIPRFCGKCHSNAEFMKKYNPRLRVDQEAEYYTSIHGKRLVQGDRKVATCISCHGYHGIRAVGDPQAPVYPTNVARTCGRCHANAGYMQSYSIPHDQLEKWQASVHAEALLKKNDLSAPTCNDCHGNHGAVPPGVTSVANVCGACHTRQAELFRKSPHKPAFDEMGLGECLVCHGNHEIHHPSDEMLGVGDQATCVACHSEGEPAYQAAQTMRRMIDQMVRELNQAEALVDRAARAGMEVSRAKFELNDAHDKLINARVVIHTFSVDELQKVVTPGIDTAKKAHRMGVEALNELQFRRKGLAASLVVIFLAVIGLYLKIRQIERPGA